MVAGAAWRALACVAVAVVACAGVCHAQQHGGDGHWYGSAKPSATISCGDTTYTTCPTNGLACTDVDPATCQAMCDVATATNDGFVLICAFLVFFMKAGFIMMEYGASKVAGAGQPIRTNLILFKVAETCLTAVTYFLLGYNLYTTGSMFGGDDSFGSFLTVQGTGVESARQTEPDYGMEDFLIHLFFASNCATIMTGAVIGRISFPAYLAMAAFVGSVLHPFAARWVWSLCGGPTSSAPCPSALLTFNYTPSNDCLAQERFANGYVDLAGGSIVHGIGGIAGFVLAIFTPPSPEQSAQLLAPDNYVVTLGVMIMWFAWNGAVAGGALGLTNKRWSSVARIAVVLALAGASSGCTEVLVRIWHSYKMSRPGTSIAKLRPDKASELAAQAQAQAQAPTQVPTPMLATGVQQQRSGDGVEASFRSSGTSGNTDDLPSREEMNQRTKTVESLLQAVVQHHGAHNQLWGARARHAWKTYCAYVNHARHYNRVTWVRARAAAGQLRPDGRKINQFFEELQGWGQPFEHGNFGAIAAPPDIRSLDDTDMDGLSAAPGSQHGAPRRPSGTSSASRTVRRRRRSVAERKPNPHGGEGMFGPGSAGWSSTDSLFHPGTLPTGASGSRLGGEGASESKGAPATASVGLHSGAFNGHGPQPSPLDSSAKVTVRGPNDWNTWRVTDSVVRRVLGFEVPTLVTGLRNHDARAWALEQWDRLFYIGRDGDEQTAKVEVLHAMGFRGVASAAASIQPSEALNCVMTALVAAATCGHLVPAYWGVVLGVQSWAFYTAGRHIVRKRLHLTDTLSVTAVHCFGGFCGTINVAVAYLPPASGARWRNFYNHTAHGSFATQLLVQLTGWLIISLGSFALCYLVALAFFSCGLLGLHKTPRERANTEAEVEKWHLRHCPPCLRCRVTRFTKWCQGIPCVARCHRRSARLGPRTGRRVMRSLAIPRGEASLGSLLAGGMNDPRQPLLDYGLAHTGSSAHTLSVNDDAHRDPYARSDDESVWPGSHGQRSPLYVDHSHASLSQDWGNRGLASYGSTARPASTAQAAAALSQDSRRRPESGTYAPPQVPGASSGAGQGPMTLTSLF